MYKSLVVIAILISAVLTVGMASKVNASISTFDDRTEFLAATGATSATGPLPDLGLIPGGGAAIQTVGSVTFSLAPPSSALFIGTSGVAGITDDDWTLRLPGPDIAISDIENLNADLDAPVFSLGFDFVEPENDPNIFAAFVDSTFTVTLKSGAIVVDSFTFNAPNDVAAFVGVQSTTAFDRVEIRETTGGIGNEFFGQFYTASFLPGNIVIVKDTIPNGPQDFEFVHDIGLGGSFLLGDRAARGFGGLAPGTYTVTELAVRDFALVSIRCEDPSNDSFRQGRSAVIALGSGEVIFCTFTNAIDRVKTVHAEKEVLVDLTLGRIKEVTIYAEIHENLNRLPRDPTLNKQVEVVTCDKKLDEARVLGCVESTPQEDFGLINGIQNCIPDDLPLQSPEMNTVSQVSSSNSAGMNTVVSAIRPALIKTIDAQKEVFLCEQGTKIMDVVIFTEIFENLNHLPRNPVILKQFEVLTCLKDAATLTVESCVFSPTQRIFP